MCLEPADDRNEPSVESLGEVEVRCLKDSKIAPASGRPRLGAPRFAALAPKGQALAAEDAGETGNAGALLGVAIGEHFDAFGTVLSAGFLFHAPS